MSKITIKFFAALREQLDSQGTDIVLSDKIKTVADVKDALCQQFPNWHNALASSKILTAVNHDMVSADFTVKAGDEVAFFPPVTGG